MATLLMMECSMRSIRHNGQVFGSIIQFVAVNMMHDFRRIKRTPKNLFHYAAMCADILSLDLKAQVPLIRNRALSLRPMKNDLRITMHSDSHVMFPTVALAKERLIAAFDNACVSMSPPWRFLKLAKRIAGFAESSVMHQAEAITVSAAGAICD